MGCCGAFCLFPWNAVLGSVLVGVGVGVWWVYSNAAYTNAVATITSVGIVANEVGQFKASLLGMLIFVCVLAAIMILLSIWRSIDLAARNGRRSNSSRHTLFSWVASIFAVLQFLEVFWIAAVAAATAAAVTFFAFVFGVTTLTANEAQNLMGKNLTGELSTALSAFDSLAAANPTVAAGLAPINQTLSGLRGYTGANTNGTAAGCPSFCLDLASVDAFRFINYTTRCLCNFTALNETAGYAFWTSTQLGVSLAGLTVLFVGALWLLTNIAGQISGSCEDSWHEANGGRREEEYKPAQFSSA